MHLCLKLVPDPDRVAAGRRRDHIHLFGPCHRVQEDALTVVEVLDIEEIKTRRVIEILTALGLGGQRVLIVIQDADEKIERSARNLQGVTVLRAGGLNTYDVLRHEKLLMTRAAVEAVEARLGEARE